MATVYGNHLTGNIGCLFLMGTRSREYNRNGPENLSNKELNNAQTLK